MRLVRRSWSVRSMVFRRCGRLYSVSCRGRHLYDNSTRPSSVSRNCVRLRLDSSPINRLCDILYRILYDDFATISSFGRHSVCDGFAVAPRNSLGDISTMRRLDNNNAWLASMRGDRESSSSTSGPRGSFGNVSRLTAGSFDDDSAWPFTMSGNCYRLSRSTSPRHGSRDAVWVPSGYLYNLSSRPPSRRRNCNRLGLNAIPRLGSGHTLSFWDRYSRRHVSWNS